MSCALVCMYVSICVHVHIRVTERVHASLCTRACVSVFTFARACTCA